MCRIDVSELSTRIQLFTKVKHITESKNRPIKYQHVLLAQVRVQPKRTIFCKHLQFSLVFIKVHHIHLIIYKI